MGNCEDCVKINKCTKDIGIMFGFCEIDFEEKKEVNKDDDNAPDTENV